MPEDQNDVVDAILDLTRVTIVLHGEFESRNDAIRKLSALGIPNPRIATILNMETKDVTSTLGKAEKKRNKSGENAE